MKVSVTSIVEAVSASATIAAEVYVEDDGSRIRVLPTRHLLLDIYDGTFKLIEISLAGFADLMAERSKFTDLFMRWMDADFN